MSDTYDRIRLHLDLRMSNLHIIVFNRISLPVQPAGEREMLDLANCNIQLRVGPLMIVLGGGVGQTFRFLLFSSAVHCS